MSKNTVQFQSGYSSELFHEYVTSGGPQSVTKEEFIWINSMIGNVKNAIMGTYHAIKPQHLSRYFYEFYYRFNWRILIRHHITVVYHSSSPPIVRD